MPCSYYYQQLRNIDNALRFLELEGILRDNPAYQAIYKMRGELMGRIGLRVPRATQFIGMLMGLSPGTLRVWFDNEVGWMVEARETPQSPPVYHQIDAQTAVILLKPDPPPDLVHSFMKEKIYIGE